ncbi:DUF4349 domain-containing protein [Candidatus Thioglobus autotrophicus]|uniref:DUF4349 domain-containing protein n=1 Tax=Candidatus Thioglobus autotrophicus TaxID=1705394 RepID=UPI00299E8A84|nr:DUF4349 domain-containing protein [Candidatus Thioglobus autotrophicus]WPE16346.1 DUF4349 domain-containing protein [Candidatus Thioglobus autotrophicus]WPE17893.1 DUF4349 domain-containing protein [Candidatus Thioglobus autotrophicus]
MTQTKSFIIYGLLTLVGLILLVFLSTLNPLLNKAERVGGGDVSFPSSAISASYISNYSKPLLSIIPAANAVEHGLVLIKTGNLFFSVKNYKKSYKSIIDSINKFDGYVVDESSYGSNDVNLKIRVPANNFNQLFEILLKEADQERSIRKSINTKDVTEEYMDVESRIKSKKLIEDRYLEILSKATKVSELLEVEKYLGDIRTEIEQVEGRLKYLKNRSNFSTIDLKISEAQKYEKLKEDSLMAKIQDSFGMGWSRAISLMLFVTSNWFAVVLVIALIYFIKKKYM